VRASVALFERSLAVVADAAAAVRAIVAAVSAVTRWRRSRSSSIVCS